MPIYEYQCGECHHRLEALQKITDRPLRKCPDCGRTTLRRLVSAPVFRLKGGGWYETDFKSDKDSQAQSRRQGQGSPPRRSPKRKARRPEAKAADAKPARREGRRRRKAAPRSAAAARRQEGPKPAAAKPAADEAGSAVVAAPAASVIRPRLPTAAPPARNIARPCPCAPITAAEVDESLSGRPCRSPAGCIVGAITAA